MSRSQWMPPCPGTARTSYARHGISPNAWSSHLHQTPRPRSGPTGWIGSASACRRSGASGPPREPPQEAVATYRRLAEAEPAAYLPALASALNNLGIRLSEVGDKRAALEPTQEAVAIRRRLAEAEPAAYLPALASALNNLGMHLS